MTFRAVRLFVVTALAMTAACSDDSDPLAVDASPAPDAVGSPVDAASVDASTLDAAAPTISWVHFLCNESFGSHFSEYPRDS